MTNFERIKAMTIEEMARCLQTNRYPDVPHSPCYVCKYDEWFECRKSDECTDEYEVEVYRKWLESEVQYEAD